jgi:glycosyltransferase involved in cell wall biosynthesis
MVIAEAFAHGTAVAASNIGSLPNLVQKGINGITFDPGDPTSLLAQVRLAWDSPSALERLSRGARTSYESNYTAEANYRMLLDIYDHAQGACRDRQHTVRS